MLCKRQRFERGLGPTLAAFALLALASPAPAGQAGNLQPVGKLLLELDVDTSQFRLDDGDPATPDPVQLIFDQKINKPKDSCLVGLTPDGSDPTDPDALVSLSESPTDWGIDVGKFALGGRAGKGTGCGQLEFGEIGRIRVNSLLLTDASVQVEAKQDVAAKVTLILDDGVEETVVGTRYLLSGRAVSNPPAEIAAAPPAHVSIILPHRPDGGPDSGEHDDGFWNFAAPFHNVEVFETLTNADGTRGKLSIKGGGEFVISSANRSEWIAFETEGLLSCWDGFPVDEGATGSRTGEGACIARIPFESSFDGVELTFNTLDLENQGTAFAFELRFGPEAALQPIPRTVLSYAPEVDCTDVDPDDPDTFTEACIGLDLCLGTPIRRCGDRFGIGCQEDADCTDGSACRLIDLLPPALGFPDLVTESPATLEYGCVCEEDVLYLGPGLCDDGSSCEEDADCTDESDCQLFSDDRIVVEQCIFALGDLKARRRR
ncbi:MAG: hypothetical protein ACYTFI_22830 [Planctomycetota bacterium]|jgi:hypothetical protein